MAQPTDTNLYAQVQRLQKRVNELENQKANTDRVLGVQFIESLKERLGALSGEGTSGVTTSNIDREISTSGATADVLDYPDGFMRVDFEGAVRNIPFYNNI